MTPAELLLIASTAAILMVTVLHMLTNIRIPRVLDVVVITSATALASAVFTISPISFIMSAGLLALTVIGWISVFYKIRTPITMKIMLIAVVIAAVWTILAVI